MAKVILTVDDLAGATGVEVTTSGTGHPAIEPADGAGALAKATETRHHLVTACAPFAAQQGLAAVKGMLG